MSLTNSQYDAIMRIYDSVRSNNQRILDNRYNEVTALCPEIIDIEQQIVSLSLAAATERISSNTTAAKDAKGINVNKEYLKELDNLNQRKRDCLKQIGKPNNYLDEIYDCPICKDTGYINQRKCSCFTKKAIDLVYHDSNLKNITDNENFNTFSYEWYDNKNVNPANGLTPYNNMHRIVDSCHNFIDNFDKEAPNLLLFGDTGVGKTFLTNCIAKELLDSSHSVIYLTAIELFRKFEEKDFNKSDKINSFDNDYILDCDLLIIDDLGTEVANTYTISKLFYCINERILRKKSIIISTNLSLPQIRDMYSERIFSRLTSSYIILKLFGNDIRIMKRTGNKNF